MTTQTGQKPLVLITSPHFAKGYQLGRVWYFNGEAELPIDDVYLIVNIEAYCKRGMHHHPEWLAERIGFLMGMVSGRLLPEESTGE